MLEFRRYCSSHLPLHQLADIVKDISDSYGRVNNNALCKRLAYATYFAFILHCNSIKSRSIVFYLKVFPSKTGNVGSRKRIGVEQELWSQCRRVEMTGMWKIIEKCHKWAFYLRCMPQYYRGNWRKKWRRDGWFRTYRRVSEEKEARSTICTY